MRGTGTRNAQYEPGSWKTRDKYPAQAGEREGSRRMDSVFLPANQNLTLPSDLILTPDGPTMRSIGSPSFFFPPK